MPSMAIAWANWEIKASATLSAEADKLDGKLASSYIDNTSLV